MDGRLPEDRESRVNPERVVHLGPLDCIRPCQEHHSIYHLQSPMRDGYARYRPIRVNNGEAPHHKLPNPEHYAKVHSVLGGYQPHRVEYRTISCKDQCRREPYPQPYRQIRESNDLIARTQQRGDKSHDKGECNDVGTRNRQIPHQPVNNELSTMDRFR